MLILHDPKVLEHNTIEILGARLIPALESPERITSILQSLENSTHVVQVTGDENDSKSPLDPILSCTHDRGYLAHLQFSHSDWVSAGHIKEEESILPECFPSFAMPQIQGGTDEAVRGSIPPKDIFARTGFYAFDMSSGIMSHTYSSAIASATLACKAASLVMSESSTPAESELRTAFALCRPPGHHCDTRRAGGYCYLNNAVIVTEFLVSSITSELRGAQNRDQNLSILDIDFHHGNGTQSYFYDRQIRYVSIHGENEYPYYTGHRDENGTGLGHGYTHNLPLSSGSSAEEYLLTLRQALDKIDWPKTAYLVISMGFDTFHLDPLGSFKLDVEDYFAIGRMISHKTQSCGVKTVILLEGGYVIEHIGECLVAFGDGWDAQKT